MLALQHYDLLFLLHLTIAHSAEVSLRAALFVVLNFEQISLFLRKALAVILAL